MSDDKNKVLDMDELFGQMETIKVKWQGLKYELLRMDGISPKQAVQFQKLQSRANMLATASDKASEEKDAEELEALVNEMLKILCVTLPVNELKFGMKMQIIQFYVAESQLKKNQEIPPMNKPTGETSSPESVSGTG